ncbi:MAG: methyltransferase domain-containing protein [Nitrospina sp.]|nr:methyltransferase domain-containing protein [Nitrospina sp.]
MPRNQNQILQDRIDQLLPQDRGLRILEAGCGSVSHISFGTVEHLVGIDISEKQLGRNEQLNEKILGDLQTYELGKETFDVIVSWDVLEHIEHPEKALMNFFQATRPGGLIILAAPNFWSLKGMVTWILPHRMHVWFYRYVIGDKRAGTQDFGPFKTYLKSSMWPENICKSAEGQGFSVEMFDEYEGPVPRHLRTKSKVFDLAFSLLGGVSRVLTAGKIDLNNSDYMLILKKK